MATSHSAPLVRVRSPAARAHKTSAGTPSRPAAERIEAIWKRQRIAQVKDGELASGVSALIERAAASGFFGDRFDGMKRVTGFGPDGTLEVQLCPRRIKTPSARGPHAASECALCSPPGTEKGLRWRDYVIWPNAYPYVPAQSEHVVITAAQHQPQGFSPELLADMIDYQRAASAKGPVTLHYNGLASNSQFHLHWQATRETLPLQRLLDAGDLPVRRLRTDPEGSIDALEHGFYAGILVSGSTAFVCGWAQRIIEKLDTDPVVRGTYGLLLLRQRGGRVRLVIQPRRADDLKPKVEPFGTVGLGSFSLGGILVLPRPEIPADLEQVVVEASRRTCVHPSELTWLTGLTQGSLVPVLRARAA